MEPISTGDKIQPVHIRMGKGIAGKEPQTSIQVLDKGKSPKDTPWTTWTWDEYQKNVDDFAKSLKSLGFERSDIINIIGFGAPEWVIANYGTIMAGGIATGVYATNGPEACKYQAEHSGAKVIVVEGVKQLEKYYSISKDLPKLKALVMYGPDNVPEEAKNNLSVPLYSFGEFMELGKNVSDRDLMAHGDPLMGAAGNNDGMGIDISVPNMAAFADDNNDLINALAVASNAAVAAATKASDRTRTTDHGDTRTRTPLATTTTGLTSTSTSLSLFPPEGPEHHHALYMELRSKALEVSIVEPSMKHHLKKTILHPKVHNFNSAIARTIAYRLISSCGNDPTFCVDELTLILEDSMKSPSLEYGSTMANAVYEDILACARRDLACESELEIVLFYKGFASLVCHRAARRSTRHVGLWLQSQASAAFGVDIHPAAEIGSGVFFDHASGLVIGETAVVGNNCTLLHGVTLGGTGKVSGNRHPKVGNNVLIGAGVSILGNIKIGDSAKIGAGSMVLKPIPNGATAVGAPAKIIGWATNSFDVFLTPQSRRVRGATSTGNERLFEIMDNELQNVRVIRRGPRHEAIKSDIIEPLLHEGRSFFIRQGNHNNFTLVVDPLTNETLIEMLESLIRASWS